MEHLLALIGLVVVLVCVFWLYWRLDQEKQRADEWMKIAQDHAGCLEKLRTALREGRHVWPILDRIDQELAKGEPRDN